MSGSLMRHSVFRVQVIVSTNVPRDPRAVHDLSDGMTVLPAFSAVDIAEALRRDRDVLVARWLERILARVALVPNRVFPSNELLNHVPLLIDGIADLVEHADVALNAESTVIAKAMELGALRHAQGFDANAILKEHELLAGVIFAYLGDLVSTRGTGWPAPDVMRSWQRVAHAIDLIRQATVAQFLRLSSEQVQEREQRLRHFNRMVSHELKSHASALKGAAALLEEEWITEAERARFVRMVSDNVRGIQKVLEHLEVLSRVETDTRRRRNVLLPHAALEAARQVRDAAQRTGVRIEISHELPAVEVDAAAVELCLVNYLSNAIKYSDPTASERRVIVEAEVVITEARDGSELHVQVRDNGIGVPANMRSRLFEQYYRVPGMTVTGIEGSGLGLSIVRDTIEHLGGRAWAEFPEAGGSIFSFALPSRRSEDAAAAGIQ